MHNSSHGSLSNPDLEKWRATGRTVELLGHTVFYRDEGTGPTLLLVHGFPTSSWDWRQVMSALSQNFRVIAPDMLGYGFSDKPMSADYSTSAHAQMHLALLGHLGIDKAHIMTYSFGSSVVQHIMHESLEASSALDIPTITFLNGGLFPGSNHPNRSQRLLLSPLGPIMARLVTQASLGKGLRAIFGPESQPSAQLIHDYWELLCLNDGRKRLPQLIGYLHDRKRYAATWRRALIDYPAAKQLIVGMSDTISGPDMAAEFRKYLPDVPVIELEGIGHYPQIEAPDSVISAVRKICAETQ